MDFFTGTQPIACPYCGECFDIVVDHSIAEQEYIEDCYVCCRPIHLRVEVEAQQVRISARSENEC